MAATPRPQLETLRAWMRDCVAGYSSRSPATIDLRVTFRDLGLQSEQVLGLLERFGKYTGHRFAATSAWEHPTPDALVKHVATASGSPDARTVSPRERDRTSTRNEPIAIVGMACRLPGGVASPADFWKLLCEGRSGVREVPPERFDVEAYFDEDPRAPGKMSTRWAGLIDGIDRFDAAFFGISPREARQMDPQQRLVLELCWQALEDAGVDPMSLRGAPVGVFVGSMWSDYARLVHQDLTAIDSHSATGQCTSIISARVSYALGLSGASMTVNTACSSSAVAIHLAIQALRRGDTELALAGGVHLMASPESTVAMTKFGAMNPAGQCRAFDASANGYVRGEGAGILLLKPLSRALADGDDIHAVIRGSAANNDGFSNGLTAPNPRAQEDVIRRALADARATPESIDYVEAHGPGTILGDPLEANALGAVFAESRAGAEPLRIGSVKTNLGHLEAAAGVTGVMKLALLLRHRAFVPNLHFDAGNPHISFEALRLRVQTELASWPSTSTLPRGGVSSFGFGGTNCHLVLEAAPIGVATSVPLSAESPKALRRRVLGAIDVLSRTPSIREATVLCREIAGRDGAAAYRVAPVAESAEGLIQELTALVSAGADLKGPAHVSPRRPRLVFVCPGQGGHWPGMMRTTLASEPVFRESMLACDRLVRDRHGWSVVDELCGNVASRFDEPLVMQLSQFCIQFSLGALWKAWGLEPDAIVGHSLGEVAACVLAGILTLSDGVKIVGERARLMSEPEGAGGMLSVVLASPADAERAVALAKPLELAVHNSPMGIVFSGAISALGPARERLEAAGFVARPVANLPCACHSSLLDPLRARLVAALAGITPANGDVRVRSTVLDGFIDGPACGPEYWGMNLRQPVRFRQAIESLASEGPTVFLELGAHPLLLKSIEHTVPHGAVTLSSGHRGEDERRRLLETASELYRRGFEPRWDAILGAGDEPVFSGTVEDLAAHFGQAPERALGDLVPFVVSARTEAALAAQLGALRAHVEHRPFADLGSVARSLAGSRARLESRAVVLAASRGSLLDGLARLAAGEEPELSITGEARSGAALATLFTGQGSQRLGMGRRLATCFPEFRRSIDATFAAFEGDLRVALPSVLDAEPGSARAALLDETAYAQPALFAVEVALHRLFESWGVRGSWLLGHSVGELAAAHVAGVLSLQDACTVVAARGRLMQELPPGGAMVALEAAEAEIAPWLERHAGRLSLAAVNGPESLVLSGDERAVQEVERDFRKRRRDVTRLRVSHAFHSSRMDPMLAAFGDVLSSVELRPAEIPIVSSASGLLEPPETWASPEYWVGQVRQPVRFHDALQTVHEAGASLFLELGPHAVLTRFARAAFAEKPVPAWCALQQDHDERETVLRALSGLHVNGQDVDWAAFFAAHPGPRASLPTYSFQRERHWIEGAKRTDVRSTGMAPAEHPLLDAELVLAGDSRPAIFTAVWDRGVLSRLPRGASRVASGAVFVELALAAAHRLGDEGIQTLALEAPLAIEGERRIGVQLIVEPPSTDGARAFGVYSRATDAAPDAPWSLHAAGKLGPVPVSPLSAREWPGADTIADELFAPESDAAVRSARRIDGAVFVETALPEDDEPTESGYHLHPALLAAALQPLRLDGEPVEFRGLRADARGARALRAEARRVPGGGFAVAFTDPQGAALGVASEIVVQATATGLAPRPTAASMYRVAWMDVLSSTGRGLEDCVVVGSESMFPGVPERHASLDGLIATLSAGAPLPRRVVLAGTASRPEGSPAAATARFVEDVKRWLADDRFADGRLVILTERAIATASTEDVIDLDHAPVWGFGRTVQLEHPDRDVLLLDVDQPDPRVELVRAALASPEPQLAIRGETLKVPRLARVASAGGPRPSLAAGTVLVTGGSGTLGGLLAEHLVANHGVRHLVLCSRSGGGAELEAKLAAQGARVTRVACDVARRDDVAALLASIPESHPLIAVFHTAGILDDGIVAAQDGERIARVFAPKVDGAFHLHELTLDRPLAAFVLFSSTVAVLGNGGQSNYGAANAFLDALAHRRRALGLPATALGWGYWASQSKLTQHMEAVDVARFTRGGMRPLSEEEGLALLDRALESAEPHLVPVHLDTRSIEQLTEVPPLLQGLVRTKRRGARASASALGARLMAIPATERQSVLLEAVVAAAAAVTGAPVSTLAPGRPLKDAGLDSLMAVELRNRLARATGLRLPSTLLFDHPTPGALSRVLLDLLDGKKTSTPVVDSRSGVDRNEPIAIVAMSCRYPGGADSPEELWALMAEGRDATTEFPRDRGWALERLFDADPDAIGKTYARAGGFLHDVAEFDPEFFGITPREAMAMDPQQRVLLEASWEAWERAGIDSRVLEGTKTGVFVGLNYHDYASHAPDMPAEAEGYLTVGTQGSVAAGRIAYHYGLEGPAMCVDTACSSSLVSVHLACQALRQDECSLALAGGVTIMSTPTTFIEFSRQRGLAPDGRSKPFSARADGVAWGEGAGLLVLERLSDALRNGHPVLAVIRGSAVNQDGRSQGLTAPNGPAQQRVIRQALASAGLSSRDIDAVEAHGTGTTLGDPIEAEALIAVYGEGRSPENPLLLGSVKSNIGHAQSAAGVAGIIKMVLGLENEVLPRSLHADVPTPHVDWSAGTVRLLHDAVPWKANGHPRRAGVSAFGIGGTNAHVIVEEAPARAASAVMVADVTEHGPLPFVLSGKDDRGLRAAAARLREYLGASPALRPLDVAYSLSVSRAALDARAVVIAGHRDELLARLDDLSGRRSHPLLLTGEGTGTPGKLAFVFSGQGSQHCGAGLALYERLPRFRVALDAVLAHFEASFAAALKSAMFAPVGSPEAAWLDRTEYAQPALFALEVALFRLLEEWGVVPDLLSGHSVGEIAVAHVAGVFSLRDACALVAARGRLMQALPEGGAMYALEADEGELEASLLEEHGLSLAAINGERSVVVSGDAPSAAALAERFAAEGRRVRRLTVSHAFHSAHMEPMLDDFARVVEGLARGAARLPIVSSLTGERVAPEALASPDYWIRQVRCPVRFHAAVQALQASGARTYLELGPGSVLAGLVEGTLAGAARVCPVLPVSASLDEADGEVRAMMRALGAVHVSGGTVDLRALFEPHGARVLPLPTYPFQRRRFWPDAATRRRTEPPPESTRRSVEITDDFEAISSRLGSLTDSQRAAWAEVAPLVAAFRGESQARQVLDDQRYRVEWTRIARSASPSIRGSWLLLSPATERALGSTLGRAFEAHGARVVHFELQGERDLDEALTGAFDGVLLLASDTAAVSAGSVVPRCLADALRVARACEKSGQAAPLWIVTRGAVAASSLDAPPSPEQAMVWGLGRVVSLERPEGFGGLVDLGSSAPTRAVAAALVAAIGAGEDELAVRPEGVFARRLVHAPRARTENAAPSFGGTALITGGTGALGARVARWLSDRGTRHVVLASRRGEASEAASALRRELEGRGTKVTIAAVDAADRAALSALLDSIHDSGEELRTVVHAAGVNDYTNVPALTEERLSETLRAKVLGARNLDELLAERPPAHFVLFASGAGVWGSAGQGAYAASNAYLDALAERRAAAGLPAASIAWGIWGGGGMASGIIDQLSRIGVLPLDPDTALAAIEDVLSDGTANLTVAAFEWQAFAAAYSASRERRLLASVVPATDAEIASAGTDDTPMHAFAARLAALPAGPARHRLLLTSVCEAMAGVLGVAPESVQPARALKELGMDSLMAVQLKNRLSQLTGLRLPATLLFNHPNPAAIAGFLAGRLATRVVDAAPGSSLLEELERLEGLTPDEAESHLGAEVTAKLAALASRWGVPNGRSSWPPPVTGTEVMNGVDDEQLFRLVDESIGQQGI